MLNLLHVVWNEHSGKLLLWKFNSAVVHRTSIVLSFGIRPIGVMPFGASSNSQVISAVLRLNVSLRTDPSL